MKLVEHGAGGCNAIDPDYSKDEFDEEVAALEALYGYGLMTAIEGPIDIVMLAEGSDAQSGEIELESILSLDAGDTLHYPKTCSTLTNDSELPVRIVENTGREIYFVIRDEPYIEDWKGPLQPKLVKALAAQGVKVRDNAIFLSHV